MKIQKITQSTRKENRAVIHMENGEVFSVHKDLLVENQLWVDKDIDEELKVKLARADVVYKLYDNALLKLSLRLHSEKELIDKLRKYIFKKNLEVTDEQISEVMERLRKYGLLDDEKFAQQFIEIKSNKKSIFEIKQLLRLKGVSSVIIDKVANENLEDKEEGVLEKLAEKKLNSLRSKELSKKVLRMKTLNYLYRKGFPFDKSKNIINQLLEDE